MRSALYLLDTSVLLALIRGNELGKFIRHTFSLENPAVRSLISRVPHLSRRAVDPSRFLRRVGAFFHSCPFALIRG